MMKPGEDLFELGRRRDIWLQCHSMKYVCRMLEAEYNEVANKHVVNTQAGWTEDTMATEHSLTVRIIEERCEWHRKPCIKGYVDMGSSFMSVNHVVQWEVEKAIGVPETIVVGDTSSTVHRYGRGDTSRCASARCVLRGFVLERMN
eukprot:2585646-Pleurochrysis_carterae.AAC.1